MTSSQAEKIEVALEMMILEKAEGAAEAHASFAHFKSSMFGALFGKVGYEPAMFIANEVLKRYRASLEATSPISNSDYQMLTATARELEKALPGAIIKFSEMVKRKNNKLNSDQWIDWTMAERDDAGDVVFNEYGEIALPRTAVRS